VAVGFGISTPEQAGTVGRVADGVVVGSALVEILGRDGVRAARLFLGSLRQALDEGEPA
jgi:tryptophan synthase alpha chain